MSSNQTEQMKGIPEVVMEPVEPFGLLITSNVPGADIGRPLVDLLPGLARNEKIVVLRGFRSFPDAVDFDAFARRLGKPMEWPFGTVLELVEHEDPADSVFSNGFLPFHWDGMYVSHIPEFQVFSCVEAPGGDDGGRTVFADTTAILDGAGERERDLWSKITITYTIRQAAHYGGRAKSPLVVPHPAEGYPTIRFNEPMPKDEDVVNRSELTIEGVEPEDANHALAHLQAALYDPRYNYRHAWQEGDVVIANNYALLHTRERYRSHAPRHLRRIHILGDPPFRNPAVA
ncbi:TauD/TfdA family dioxygenase [Actinocrispum sp. NPDC049592]|uniref:TauD/TfdA dioxygenase family protein n=1 Tax=Actinocrispum sp. NPDC049592 TaxID=3154835 RepID=UPI00343E4432